LYGRYIRAREIRHSQRDTNRYVRPFEWGSDFILEHVNGDDPHHIFTRHSEQAMADSDRFYALPEVSDFKLTGELLTWASALQTPDQVNNLARARFFPVQNNGDASRPRRAVIALPQWNAQPDSHVELCRLLQRLGISALRVTMPYHEERRPAELERADHLVSSNIGRTIQSMRQAVLDTRAAVRWLVDQGYERIGIIGTSIGSCTAFLAFAHEPRVNVGVFNHVSGYFADVVWHGISTQHVRQGFGKNINLEQLRQYWLPISPLPFIGRLLKMEPRPMRFIAARYDLTFPTDLSRKVISEVRRHNIPLDVAWLPCGHYTSGEKPWVYLDGWKIVSFFRKHL
jgi:dienelactone hydrolase